MHRLLSRSGCSCRSKGKHGSQAQQSPSSVNCKQGQRTSVTLHLLLKASSLPPHSLSCSPSPAHLPLVSHERRLFKERSPRQQMPVTNRQPGRCSRSTTIRFDVHSRGTPGARVSRVTSSIASRLHTLCVCVCSRRGAGDGSDAHSPSHAVSRRRSARCCCRESALVAS